MTRLKNKDYATNGSGLEVEVPTRRSDIYEVGSSNSRKCGLNSVQGVFLVFHFMNDPPMYGSISNGALQFLIVD
ncbi:hypothetical protein TorRG33x02_132910 [Trema orientale]|uniref:Uncharacterized protein n=1 Tax=Trema orientale TaxID=63057 RepID=A0A2P5EZB8_TREOI|nr:hypothetical protein TorRG33x02_132910 [Trema orientale]